MSWHESPGPTPPPDMPPPPPPPADPAAREAAGDVQACSCPGGYAYDPETGRWGLCRRCGGTGVLRAAAIKVRIAE